MNPRDVKAIVQNLPHMSLSQAEWITEHIRKFRLGRVLEVGFYHGVSTCYLAAAVQPLDGHVTTIDLPASAKREPRIEELLERCGLTERVTVYREAAGASWRLMKMLPCNQPLFDFCYLDGGHTWQCTGFLFFLAEKLLRPGGWLLFDDLDYAVARTPDINLPWAAKLTEEELTTCQVGKVWELLVKGHPGFFNLIERGHWGLCQKKF
jgi:predicted O-methyltransferase YrrM